VTAYAGTASYASTRPLRRPVTKVAVGFGVAVLPMLRPAGPGNTGGVDVALAVVILVTALWVSGRTQVVRLPYAFPVGLSVAAGALAGTVHSSGLLALAQDIFVLCCAAAVANLGRDADLLDTLAKAWAYSATVWAAAMTLGVVTGVSWLAGTSARDGTRAAFTLGDPNLAADYFLVALLVMRACQRPRRRLWRTLACALVVTAIILTLSNGGILALGVATVVGWAFGAVRRQRTALAVAAVCLVALGGVVAASTIDLASLADHAKQSSPMLRDSLGRESESGGSRSTLFAETSGLWLHGDSLIGLGPGQVEPTLRRDQAPYVKEAHDDYLAALTERGLLGAAALTLLGAGLVVRCRRIGRQGALSARYAAVVPRPELLGAAVVALACSGWFYEVLHFRHVWALFGLIAAVDLWGRRATPEGRQERRDAQ
jgi:O-antigen ligase